MRRILVCILLLSLLTAASSDTFDITQQNGKVVLLDFWASWCVPCRRSFPWMNDMQQKYGDAGLVVVGVNLDNNENDATEFLHDYPANFRIVYDTEKELARSMGVQAMPSSFLFDRNGELIDSHMGFKVRQQPEYEAAIVAALARAKENNE